MYAASSITRWVKVKPLRFWSVSADTMRMVDPFLNVMIRSAELQEATSGLFTPVALARSLKVFLDWAKIGETNRQ
jgi:hypothetical protein